MKTVILIGSPSAPLIYFVNEINRVQKVDLVIMERNKPAILNNDQQKTAFGFEKVLRYFLFKIEMKKKSARKFILDQANAKAADNIFQGRHQAIDSEISTLEVDNINSDIVKEKLSQIRPELLLDHGTALLSNDVIDLAKLSLNLHWGLSPYYRGVNCAQRALLNWDPFNIGVTIHKLVKKIDGGDILGQARVEVMDDDNIFSITAKKTQLGTEIVKKAVIDLQAGKELQFKKQSTDDGYLTRKSQWNPHLQNYFDSIDTNLIRKMKKKPSRKALEIINYHPLTS